MVDILLKGSIFIFFSFLLSSSLPLDCPPSVISIHSVGYSPSPSLYKMRMLIAKSCLTLCDPRDCSPSDFSVHRIFQTRRLEWSGLLFLSSGDIPDPAMEPTSSALAGTMLSLKSIKSGLKVLCLRALHGSAESPGL